jgi:2-dehydropantoate 2-reductase
VRILVVGAGATGGYFGARLADAGRDLTFLVRPAQAQRLRTDGLEVVSPHGNLHLTPRIVTAAELAPGYDLVVLAVKAFALPAALDDLAAAVGSQTMVLPFLNGLRHLDALTERFGQQPILGGACLVSTVVDERGRIVQLSELQELSYGERDGTASARIAALDGVMQGAGFGARASLHIIQDMWEKWVALAALGGITCLLRGTVGDIAAVPGGANLALQLLAECSAVATAAGHPPRTAFFERAQSMLTQAGSPLASSMYRDLQSGRSVEADQILGDLLGRAQQFNLTTPLLAAAFANLRVYVHASSRVAR